MKGRKRHKMRSFSKIKQSCRTVFTKQLSLVNLAVMSIMNYLPISNGKDNCLKSHFCLSCKNDEMSLRPFWHNTVDILHGRRRSYTLFMLYENPLSPCRTLYATERANYYQSSTNDSQQSTSRPYWRPLVTMSIKFYNHLM